MHAKCWKEKKPTTKNTLPASLPFRIDGAKSFLDKSIYKRKVYSDIGLSQEMSTISKTQSNLTCKRNWKKKRQSPKLVTKEIIKIRVEINGKRPQIITIKMCFKYNIQQKKDNQGIQETIRTETKVKRNQPTKTSNTVIINHGS